MNSPIFLIITLLIFALIVPSAMAQPMAQPQGYISGFVKNAPMPIYVSLHSDNAIIKSATWYLNATDHNYHIKGFVENTVPRAAMLFMTLNFYDNATAVKLSTGGNFSYEPSTGVPANLTIPYDMNTGYNASDTREFRTIDGTLS
jgi:hypothetical protein